MGNDFSGTVIGGMGDIQAAQVTASKVISL